MFPARNAQSAMGTVDQRISLFAPGSSPDSTAYDIPKSATIYELPRLAIEGNGQDVFVVQSAFRGVCPDPRVSSQRPKFVSPTKRA
jgi:hypothetical protein